MNVVGHSEESKDQEDAQNGPDEMTDRDDSGVSDDVVMEFVGRGVGGDDSKAELERQEDELDGGQPDPRLAHVAPLRGEQRQNSLRPALSHTCSYGQRHEEAVAEGDDKEGDLSDGLGAGRDEDEHDNAGDAEAQGQLSVEDSQIAQI